MHLLLSPKLDQLPWVLLPKPVLETVVLFDVAISVLELIQCGLEYLDGTLCWYQLILSSVARFSTLRPQHAEVDLLPSLSMVDGSLFARANAAIHFRKHSSIHQFEEHEASLLVQDLLMCRVFLLLMKLLGLLGGIDHSQTTSKWTSYYHQVPNCINLQSKYHLPHTCILDEYLIQLVDLIPFILTCQEAVDPP